MRRFILFCLILLFPLLAFAEGTRAVAVLLDVSKSIPQKEFEKAKTVFAQFIDRAAPKETITIYAFGNELKAIDPAQLKNIEATESNTMLYDAAYDVAQNLVISPAQHKAILIVSDGYDTKSATVLEDTVYYANTNGIAIYGVGVGKFNRRSLERIAKLTGGKFLELSDPQFLNDLNQAIDTQKESTGAKPQPQQTALQQAIASRPVVPAPVVPAAPAQEKSGLPYLWIAAIFGGALLLVAFIFVIVRSVTKEVRKCPTCGKKLEAYQTICPNCSTAQPGQTIQTMRLAPGDGPQEITTPMDEEIQELVPQELLEKKPISEEDLSKTFVLMETPMLVVRKGRNLGQSFSLNRAFPVSIGRSRVNEILLEDSAVSGQHCRIIPENGKHVLYDLGSTNGTFVNERKVSKSILREGDTIKVGETQFLYKIEQHRN